MSKDSFRLWGQRPRVKRNRSELEMTVDKFVKSLVGQEPEGRWRVREI